MDYSTPGFPVLHCLLELAQTHVRWVGDAIQTSHLLLPLLLLPSIFLSIRIFSSESALHISCPKYWCFSFNPSNGYSALISFRIDWFDLLAIQGPLKSLLQHCNLKASEWLCCRCKFWKPVSWAMTFCRYTTVTESPPSGSNSCPLVLGPLQHQLDTSPLLVLIYSSGHKGVLLNACRIFFHL